MRVDELKSMVGNKIFTVIFTKKDGTLREMNCRLGVKKHLRGGVLAYDAKELNYLPVYDLQKEGYRMINVNTIKEIRFEGKVVTV